MHRSHVRELATAAALALTVAVPLAACGERSVSPLPAQAADTQPTATTGTTPTGSPSGSSAAGTSPPRVGRPPAVTGPTSTKTVKPHSTRPTSTCHGAVRYDLDLQNTVLDLQRSMCFHTGAVLRLQGIGPGLVTATPGSLVSQSYEAGVVDLRFVRPGTVTVTIPQNDQNHTITVVVIR